MKGAKGYQNRLKVLVPLIFLLLHLSCGRKGPPVPPRVVVPPPVNDLVAELMGDEVRLSWSIPKKGDAIFEGMKKFRIFRHEVHTAVEECPGCPIPFKPLLDIRLKDPEPAQIEKDRIIYCEEVERGYRYSYKVLGYHKSGGVSEDSNIIKLTVEQGVTNPTTPEATNKD